MAPLKSPGRRARLDSAAANNNGTPFAGEPKRSNHQEDTNSSVTPSESTRLIDPSSPSHTPHSPLETLPVEVVNHILSYLVLPRSRLAGLTEQQSSAPHSAQRTIKDNEDLATPPDTHRFAADLFAWTRLRHPFNALALTSHRCHQLVESYCSHLVKACNRFNLPFTHASTHGAHTVHPTLQSLVYRRLWLQAAPRGCVFCGAILSNYPHGRAYRLLLTCEDCFYAQTLNWHEVQHQYHIMDSAVLFAHKVRCTGPDLTWILRIDVEALALELYGTRVFHDTRSQGKERSCEVCGQAGRVGKSSPPRIRRLPSHVTRTPRGRRGV